MPLAYFCLYILKNKDTTIVQFLKNQETNFDTSLSFSNFELVQLLMYHFWNTFIL